MQIFPSNNPELKVYKIGGLVVPLNENSTFVIKFQSKEDILHT